ncbi:septum formation initiator family protein [Actinokineospora auranticolor]|uniref:FtsB family cell division protein n=1 Tax=Actinokineospora auranticolor TaxID=155976 RepID=UPI001FE642AA|nr:septum formation initiator family protein [Actinokineospora auranticolor]
MRTRPTAPDKEKPRAVRQVRQAAQQKLRKRGGVLGLATTRRAAVVATVVCALALSVAVPLRNYLSQRSEVEVVEQKQAELRRQYDELVKRKERLADPEQVRAQARERLKYVMPGETPYLVELPPGAAGTEDEHATTQPVPQQSWYENLWDSVTGAGR